MPVPTDNITLSHQPLAEAENLTDLFPTTAVSVTVPTAQPNNMLSGIPSDGGGETVTYDVLISNASVPISAGQDTAVLVGDNLLIYSEANTFGEPINLALSEVATLDPTVLIINEPLTQTVSETSNRPFISFQIEAEKVGSDETAKSFNKPVRMAIDLRNYGYDTAEIGGTFYISYRDESDPSLWHDVPITVHQTDGLISADVSHFSDWSAGWQPPTPWAPSWTLPTTSDFSGAATFSYPIEVPPGRNGLQPNIALSYSSRNIDGAIRSASKGNVASG